MYVIGIDPGKTSGAYCLITEQGIVLEREPMPEMFMLCDRLEQIKAEALRSERELHCYLEKAQTMPKQGGVSVFRYGQHYGNLEGILLSLQIRHTVVHPSTWTRVMHAGCSVKEKGRSGAKKRSFEAAQRLFPGESFLATERSSKPHDGIIDAMLIAEYGRRQIKHGPTNTEPES